MLVASLVIRLEDNGHHTIKVCRVICISPKGFEVLHCLVAEEYDICVESLVVWSCTRIELV